jgi:hypothetical protein
MMSQYTTPNLTIGASSVTTYAYRRYGRPALSPSSSSTSAKRTRAPSPGAEDILYLFSSPPQASQAKGMEFVNRIFTRTEWRDADVTLIGRDAQAAAIIKWGSATSPSSHA